ncbi:AbrB family transcriptional regulator [Clostridia bacterium OttesenSCG-928-O13]|nr:AbrB family transcriptional regulator [Clostridia bacterium OttesenSCG-928-O13]
MNAFLSSATGFVLLCAVSVAGWLLFEKLKIPTAAILGSIAAVGLANVLGLPMGAPAFFKPGLSVAMGIMLGLRFNLKLKGLLKEILLVGAWLVGLSLIAAKALTLAGVAAPTALFAAMPGGIAEISLMALGFGADAFVVALLQSTRLLLTMIIFPALAKRVGPAPAGGPPEPEKEQTAPARTPAKGDWALIVLMGLGAGALCQWLGVPAGAMLGPMLTVGAFTKARGFTVKLNKTLQKCLQAGVGGLVGLSITRQSVMAVGSNVVPIVLLNVLVVGGSLLLAFVLEKLSGWDRATCLLSCSPAGLSPTVLLSMELGADAGRVALFQVLRLVTVLVFAPISAQMLL